MFDCRGTWLVIGLARSGCAAAGLLSSRGATVLGADDASDDELRRRWWALDLDAEPACKRILTGPDWWSDLPPVDGVVLSPGVPTSHPAVAACAAGTSVIGELELGWRFFQGRALAVTGTNGKTTTTELTAHLLRQAGWDARAVGNLGRPLSGEVATLGPDSVAVIEASSFQLETITSFSPLAGAVLNLAPDHLDRYEDLAAYYAAKRRLCEAVHDAGLFVTWTECPEALSWAASRRTLFGRRQDGASVFIEADWLTRTNEGIEQRLLPVTEIALAGRPNHLNVMAAVALLEPCGVSAADIAAGLRTFRGLPHRQQCIANAAGLCFVDDSKATNVHAVCAGLEGYERDVVLILGGRGKGEDYSPLREALTPVSHVVLIGEEADAIAGALDAKMGVSRAGDMDEAVATAAAAASGAGTVLLSPACASFDMFVDYHARGEAFAAAARRWCRAREPEPES